MNMLGQEVRTPLVIESSAINSAIAGGGATTTVVKNTPSIHAKIIDLIVKPSVDLDAVYLIIYAASGRIALTVQVHGGVLAGTQQPVRYGDLGGNDEVIGDYYDVAVKTKVPAAAGTIVVWTAARS